MNKLILLIAFICFSVVGFSQNTVTTNETEKNVVKTTVNNKVTLNKNVAKNNSNTSTAKKTTNKKQTKQTGVTVIAKRPEPTIFKPITPVDTNQTQAPQ